MSWWLEPLVEQLEQGSACVLVIVADLSGSGPREAGARMLVSEHRTCGTIGGGELEWQAIAHARKLLNDYTEADDCPHIVSYALGPDLGQCCGGRVVLAYEPFAPVDLAWVRGLNSEVASGEGAWRIGRSLRLGRNGRAVREITQAPTIKFACDVLDREILIQERIGSDLSPIWVFGAGHVGRALVRALAPLPFDVTWVDARADVFENAETFGAKTMALALPESAVRDAPPGTSFLVMTHSHGLDEEICAQVLAMDNFAYLGLIGSASKKARFVRRLTARGLSADVLTRLHCPIGVDRMAGLGGKDPAVIAASVAADLIFRSQNIAKTRGRIFAPNSILEKESAH